MVYWNLSRIEKCLGYKLRRFILWKRTVRITKYNWEAYLQIARNHKSFFWLGSSIFQINHLSFSCLFFPILLHCTRAITPICKSLMIFINSISTNLWTNLTMESYQNIQQNFSTDFVCSITSWPVTSGSSRGEDPLKKFFASPGKMCLHIVQKISETHRRSYYPKLVTGRFACQIRSHGNYFR